MSKRGKAYKKRKALQREAGKRGVILEHRATYRPVTPAYDQLADPAYNRHVIFWEMGELRANFEAQDESDGWISLTRTDRRCMWYDPTTRRAFWTGFDPVVEFFIRDIEQYIHEKFYTT